MKWIRYAWLRSAACSCSCSTLCTLLDNNSWLHLRNCNKDTAHENSWIYFCLVPHRASDTWNGYGMRECDSQPAALVAPCWMIIIIMIIIIHGYVCLTDTYNTAHDNSWIHSSPVPHRVSDTWNGYGMRECDAQPAALVAPCWIINHGYVCVTDTYILHMRTAG